MSVFLVRRFPRVGDSWTEYPDATFDEVCAVAADKIRDGKATIEYDVVEMAVVRQARVSARITAVDVIEHDGADR